MKLIGKKTLGIISVILILSVLISLFSACGAVRSNKYKVASLKEKKVEITDAKFHKYDKKSGIFVAKSGLIELYFDKVTYSVAIKDTAADRLWCSLPSFAGENEDASVVSVKLSDRNGNIYYLNSQDNSVAFENAAFDTLEGGISVTYKMAFDAETSKKKISELPKGTPRQR